MKTDVKLENTIDSSMQLCLEIPKNDERILSAPLKVLKIKTDVKS